MKERKGGGGKGGKNGEKEGEGKNREGEGEGKFFFRKLCNHQHKSPACEAHPSPRRSTKSGILPSTRANAWGEVETATREFANALAHEIAIMRDHLFLQAKNADLLSKALALAAPKSSTNCTTSLTPSSASLQRNHHQSTSVPGQQLKILPSLVLAGSCRLRHPPLPHWGALCHSRSKRFAT